MANTTQYRPTQSVCRRDHGSGVDPYGKVLQWARAPGAPDGPPQFEPAPEASMP